MASSSGPSVRPAPNPALAFVLVAEFFASDEISLFKNGPQPLVLIGRERRYDPTADGPPGGRHALPKKLLSGFGLRAVVCPKSVQIWV